MPSKDKQKIKEVARLLCKWNRKEITAERCIYKIWTLLEAEALEVLNDPLEKLLV